MAIRLIINEQFTGIIWRLEIDELWQLLLIELRNTEEKQVAFASVNLLTGKVNFTNFTTPERWLTGIEAAYNGVMLLHFYQTEDGPSHKGLMAVDAVTGETLWSDYALAFHHLSGKGPVVYDTRIQPQKLLLANVKTGRTEIITGQVGETGQAISWPQLLGIDELPGFIAGFNPVENTVFSLEHNNYKIVSLHALRNGQLVQALYVFEGPALIYEDLLNTDIQKIQPEAFILHKNRLIYIKNKRQLVVIFL